MSTCDVAGGGGGHVQMDRRVGLVSRQGDEDKGRQVRVGKV